MIIGILSLLLFILGFFLLFYGNDDGNLLLITLGIILMCISFIGVISFIGINADTIKNWIKI